MNGPSKVLCKGQGRGSIFLIVLIICMVAAMITMWLMESGILQLKMANAFEQGLITRKKLEAKLLQLEHEVENGFANHYPENITFLEFVPDSLVLGEEKGTNYYRVQVSDRPDANKIFSTIAVRNKPVQASFNANNNPDWIENLISKDRKSKKPLLIKFKNGQNVIVVAHYGEGTALNPTISFFDYSSGKVLREFALSVANSSAEIFGLSELCAVDVNQKGYADSIYVGDYSGTLWKMIVTSRSPSHWRLQSFSIDKGSIVGNIVAGPHPLMKGILLYLLLDKSNLQQREIHAVWDKNSLLQSYFTLVESNSLSEPLLRLGYLIFSVGNKIKMVDAFSGEKVQEEKLPLYYISDNRSSWAKPMVVEKILRENKRQLVGNMGTCEMNIDSNRLGRRTWRVSQY